MRSRKEALLVVLRSFRKAPPYVAIVLAQVVVIGAVSYGAKRFADWASEGSSSTWINYFMGSYIGSFLLIALVAYCWVTYRRARHG